MVVVRLRSAWSVYASLFTTNTRPIHALIPHKSITSGSSRKANSAGGLTASLVAYKRQSLLAVRLTLATRLTSSVSRSDTNTTAIKQLEIMHHITDCITGRLYRTPGTQRVPGYIKRQVRVDAWAWSDRSALTRGHGATGQR